MNDEIKEILARLSRYVITPDVRHDFDDLLDYITNLQQENEHLRTQVNIYENPDDLTLFYMWLNEEAKDKMKHMENEIIQLKQFNQMITEMGEDYKSRCEKAVEKLKKIQQNAIKYGVEHDAIICQELIDGLNGRSDE